MENRYVTRSTCVLCFYWPAGSSGDRAPPLGGDKMESPTVTPNPTTDRILDLTLEIIHLLTGEEYSLVKTAVLFSNIYPPIATKWQKLSAQTPERNMERKILEVTKNIAELLTGEVPVRCQDVAVYLSMEEREYLEGHRELYTAAMMGEELYEAAMMGEELPVTSPDAPQHEGSDAPSCHKRTLSGKEDGASLPESSGFVDDTGSTSVEIMEEPRSHQVTTLCPPPALRVGPPFSDVRLDPGSPDGHPNISTSEPHPDQAAGIPPRGLALQMSSRIHMVSEQGLTSPDVSRVSGDVKPSSADIKDPLPGRVGHLPAIRAPTSRDRPPPVTAQDPEEGRVASVMAEFLPLRGDMSPPATVPTLRREDSTPGEERLSYGQNSHVVGEPYSGEVGRPPVSGLPAPSDGAQLASDDGLTSSLEVEHLSHCHPSTSLGHAQFSPEVKKIAIGEDRRDTYKSLGSMQPVASEIEEEARSLEDGPSGRGQQGQYAPRQIMFLHIKEEPRSRQEGDRCLPSQTMASAIKEEPRSWQEGDRCLPSQTMASAIKEEPRSWEACGFAGREQTTLHPNTSSQVKEELYLWEVNLSSQEGKKQPLHSVAPGAGRAPCLSCNICGKSFLQSRELELHCKRHVAEKRYSCPHCGKSFRQKSDSDNHMRVHTGERPFPCAICGKRFTTRSDRAKHHRIHTGERRFMCSLCGKGFIQKVALDKHLRVHTGEKPFSCQHCGKCFSEKSNVARHLRVHSART